MRPIVSIITATYNAAATIATMIESVLEQTYPLIELVIIDGASTDNTLDILEKYRDGIAYQTSEPDKGIYDALNKGIDAATGDWLYFLGADDKLIAEDVLEKIFMRDDIADYDLVHGISRCVSNGKLLGDPRTYESLINWNINHQATFYHRRIFELKGKYDLKYKILADYDLNLKVFRDENLNKLYLPLEICLFNDQGGASNIIVDSPFFSDRLDYFVNEDKMPLNHPPLQIFNLFHGFVMLYKHKDIRGLKHCFYAFTSGKKKFYYFLVF